MLPSALFILSRWVLGPFFRGIPHPHLLGVPGIRHLKPELRGIHPLPWSVPDSDKLDTIQHEDGFMARCVIHPMGLVKLGFKHLLAARAFETQKPRQEILWRLLLCLIAPEFVCP